MPRVSILFIIAGLTSLGLPGLSGFAAEFLVFVGTFQTSPWLGVLGVVGVAVTAVYVLRLIARVFFGPLNERWRDISDASRLETIAGVCLVGFLVLFGIYPPLMVGQIDTAVAPLIASLSR